MLIEENREHTQDWDAIDRFLRSRGMNFDRNASIRRFASGVANLNYLLWIDGRPAVLRRPPNNDAPPGAYDFARQSKILSRLGRTLPTVPLCLAYCNDLGVIGVPFIITEFREGITIGRELPEVLSGIDDIGGKLGSLILEALVQLHRVSPVEAELADLGRADGFITRQIHGWYNRASRVMSPDHMLKMSALRDWLVAHQPSDRVGTLVHLDFKLENALVDPRTLTVNGVIDWEMATIGDPFYDLMLMLVGWGEPDDAPAYSRQWSMPCKAPGWWKRRRTLETYQRLTNTALSEPDVKFYWILALFRNIGALAQLIILYQREGMPIDKARDMPSAAAAMLDHAVELTVSPLDW